MQDQLHAIMRSMATGGWDALNNLGGEVSQAAGAELDEAKRQSELVRKFFATEAGGQFLEWLIGKTLLRPPGPAEEAVTAEAYAIAKARREGQNGIVFMILQALNFKPGA